jgi:Protein of unknown function (DUF2924)
MEVPAMSEKARNRAGVRGPTGGPDAVEQEIAQLPTLDAPALRQRWAQLLGDDPPPSLGRKMMIQATAYRLQEGAFGGLRASTLRILDRVVDGAGSAESKRAPTRKAGAGTVLIREWGGITHRVTVLDNDVVYRGRRYRSLSEVARVITGTHWSGPMFFGLRNRSKEKAHG